MAKRRTFKGIPESCPVISMHKFQDRDATSQGILRAALNGSFYTQDKHQGRSAQCKFCGEKDSQYHRHWECAHFAAERELCPVEILQQVKDLPPCLTNHGWARRPAELLPFKAALLHLPDLTGVFEHHGREGTPPRDPPTMLTLFTDGSCARPTCRQSRVASWAVVRADPIEPWTFAAVARGGVPGWHQSSLRGEITALKSALQFVLQCQAHAQVWTDNARVSQVVAQVQQGVYEVGPNDKDVDLWVDVHRLVTACGPLLRGVHKVCSHQCLRNLPDPAERWIAAGNAAADRA